MRRILILLAVGATVSSTIAGASPKPAGPAGGLELRQNAQLLASRELLDLAARPSSDALTLGVELSKAAAVAGARMPDLDAADDPMMLAHASAAQAAEALAAAYGVEPDPRQFARLSDLEAPVSDALTDVIDAFISMKSAARTMNDLARVYAARNRMLDAVLALRDAVGHGAASTGACSPIAVPPAFSIDTGVCDGTYTADVALLVDGGGNDRYLNNAGGSDLIARTCRQLTVFPLDAPIDSKLPSVGAAALIDLGGDDAYGDPVRPRECGTNGGAFHGSGFLLDAEGDDTYTARGSGTNGGASAANQAISSGISAVGYLLDAAGDDTYTAGSLGTNGGGFGADCTGCLLGEAVAVGFLLDLGGSDSYTAGDGGTNGGGANVGAGFLLDAAGNDTYEAGGTGTNGGGIHGAGFLLDVDGNDAYTTRRSHGSNGAGNSGTGLLLDAAGSDTYATDASGTSTRSDCTVVPHGTIGAQIDLPNTSCEQG